MNIEEYKEDVTVSKIIKLNNSNILGFGENKQSTEDEQNKNEIVIKGSGSKYVINSKSSAFLNNKYINRDYNSPYLPYVKDSINSKSLTKGILFDKIINHTNSLNNFKYINSDITTVNDIEKYLSSKNITPLKSPNFSFDRNEKISYVHPNDLYDIEQSMKNDFIKFEEYAEKSFSLLKLK